VATDTDGWSQTPRAADKTGASTTGSVSPGASTRAGTDANPGAANAEAKGEVVPNGFDPTAAYLDQLGEGSRRTMREALSKLASWASEGRCGPHDLPWHMLRVEHTAALRTRLSSQLAPATANKHLAALRGVLKQCWRRGLMSDEAYKMAIDLPPVRGTSPRKPNQLGALELQKLAHVCTGDSSPAGARDEALLALLYGANLRRSEAVALELEDYDLSTGGLRIKNAAGRASRRFSAHDNARRSLERWILIRGPEAGPLFNPVNKGGRVERRRLSEQAIYIACQKRASEAGLPPTSPEDLRRADPSIRTGLPLEADTLSVTDLTNVA